MRKRLKIGDTEYCLSVHPFTSDIPTSSIRPSKFPLFNFLSSVRAGKWRRLYLIVPQYPIPLSLIDFASPTDHTDDEKKLSAYTL